MVYRSSTFGTVALLERAGPVLGSEGMGGLWGEHMVCLGSLGGEQSGVWCEKWHMVVGAAFCEATSHSEEEKIGNYCPQNYFGTRETPVLPQTY